jgi:hypothetical protein
MQPISVPQGKMLPSLVGVETVRIMEGGEARVTSWTDRAGHPGRRDQVRKAAVHPSGAGTTQVVAWGAAAALQAAEVRELDGKMPMDCTCHV